MNPKTKGDLTESVILSNLLKSGYRVSVPWGENCPYDLVAEKDGVFYRVQCKTGRVSSTGLKFNASSTYLKNGKYVIRTYENDADFFGVYVPETEGVYLIPVAAVTQKKEAQFPFGRLAEWVMQRVATS